MTNNFPHDYKTIKPSAYVRKAVREAQAYSAG